MSLRGSTQKHRRFISILFYSGCMIFDMGTGRLIFVNGRVNSLDVGEK